MIFLAGSLVLINGLFLTALLGVRGRVASFLTLYLTCYASVVLAGETASLLHVLNREWALTGIHLALALASGLFWLRSGRPDLAAPIRGDRSLLNELRSHPDLVLLGAGVAAALIFSAVLIIVVPPNNSDSLSYHLSRVGYWLQHGSLETWPTTRLQQLYYPVGTQLQFLWLMLFSKSDAWIGFVQWFAVLASLLGIYGLTRFLGQDRPASAFAALLFAAYPIVALQASTTQNDMTMTALFTAVLYFLALGIQEGAGPVPLGLAGLALGLALGTKQVVFFLLPALAVLLLLLLWKSRGKLFRRLLWFGISSLLAFGLLGSYIYIQNMTVFGNFLGPRETIEYFSGSQGIRRNLDGLAYNLPRLAYQAADFSGLPDPLDGYAHKAKARVVKALLEAVHFNLEGTKYVYAGNTFLLSAKTVNQEDQAWYGPLSLLLLFPAILLEGIRGVRQRDPWRIGLALMPPIFALTFFGIFLHWNPYMGRYFAPAAAATTPFIAGLFPKRSTGVRLAVAALALTVLTVTVLYNPAKPTLGKRSNWFHIWTADRITLLTIQGHEYYNMLRMVDQNVPADATLAIYNPDYMQDYGLFGADFSRRLVPVFPLPLVSDADWMEAQGADYLLIQVVDGITPPPPVSMRYLNETVGWKLYVKE